MYLLIRTINNYVMKPLLTVTTRKARKIIGVIFLSNLDNIRLKYLLKISNWLHNDWYPHIKELLVNEKQ